MKYNINRIALILFLLLIIISTIFSCNDVGVFSEEGGIGIIVPGKSIEGVNLGDTKEIVDQKLGKVIVGGVTDGLYRSWYTGVYTEGQHAGLCVFFIDKNGIGPVDLLSVAKPYNGKTKEGIGIGTSLTTVLKIYGESNKRITNTNSEQNWIIDLYCFNNRKLEIHYRDSVITGISIGYFIPMLDNPNFPCK